MSALALGGLDVICTHSHESADVLLRRHRCNRRNAEHGLVVVHRIVTGVPECPRKKSGRRCRIGAEVFVAGVSGRP